MTPATVTVTRGGCPEAVTPGSEGEDCPQGHLTGQGSPEPSHGLGWEAGLSRGRHSGQEGCSWAVTPGSGELPPCRHTGQGDTTLRLSLPTAHVQLFRSESLA